MKRRNFILGGGLLATLSLGATATNASLSNSVEVSGDFRVLVSDDVDTNLTADPNSENADSEHEWVLTDIVSEDDIDVIEFDYDFGDATGSFDGLDDDDVTVEFEQNESNDSLSDIRINSDSYSGPTATINLDGRFDRSINDRAVVTIDGIENPRSGEYHPETTFVTDGNEEATFTAQLATTTGEEFFSIDITDAPDVVSTGETVAVAFDVTNTGDGTGSQTVTGTVDDNEEYAESFTLDPEETDSDTVSYETTREDAPEIEVEVASEDRSRSRTITIAGVFSLDLDPTQQNQESVHTWTTGFVDFEGEVDEITVDYPGGNQGFEFPTLDQDDITVKIDRDGDGGTTEIDVNQDTYTGSTATFDLSGIFNTEIGGEVTVIIDGIENANKGDYEPTITLDGDDDSYSDTVEITVG